MTKVNFSSQELKLLSTKKALKMMLKSGNKFSPEKTLKTLQYERELKNLQNKLIELQNWVIKKSKEENYLILTDVAKDVQDIIAGGPVPKHIKPIWPFISFTAFHTLPKEFKDLYGINTTKLKELILIVNLKLLKFTRPFLPPFFRLIPPARWAKQRLRSKPDLKFSDKANI